MDREDFLKSIVLASIAGVTAGPVLAENQTDYKDEEPKVVQITPQVQNRMPDMTLTPVVTPTEIRFVEIPQADGESKLIVTTTPVPTNTATPTNTSTPTPTNTPTPEVTSTPTFTPTPKETLTPTATATPKTEDCVNKVWGSFYDLNGNKTASGEIKTANGYTAAIPVPEYRHYGEKLGDVVELFYPTTGSLVRVRLNDTGDMASPRYPNKYIDVTRGVARDMGWESAGTVLLCYRVVEKA